MATTCRSQRPFGWRTKVELFDHRERNGLFGLFDCRWRPSAQGTDRDVRHHQGYEHDVRSTAQRIGTSVGDSSPLNEFQEHLRTTNYVDGVNRTTRMDRLVNVS